MNKGYVNGSDLLLMVGDKCRERKSYFKSLVFRQRTYIDEFLMIQCTPTTR